MDERLAGRPLLSRPEQVLYGRLVRAFAGHIILAHVAVLRLLAADGKDRMDGAAGRPMSNRFKNSVADFVVCRADFTALAVIELEDGVKPPDTQRDKQRRKDQLLQAAGIKVIRLAADDLPPEAALKALVATLPLNSSTAQLMRRAS